MAVGGLSSIAYDYLDRPSYYQGYSKKRGKKSLESALNKELGTNMGYMENAAIGSMDANEAAGLSAQRQFAGYGLYAGSGLGLGIRPGRYSGGQVGLNGSFVRSLPPALQSQPFGANFQFKNTLPPQYQRY